MSSQYFNQPTGVPGSAPPQQPPQPLASTSSLAVVSTILGAIGMLIWPLAPIALILGIIALIAIPRSGGRKKGIVWAVIGSILGLLGTILLVFMIVVAATSDPPERSPGYEELNRAESQLRSSSDGSAHGNSPDAIEIASEISTQLAAFREAAIVREGSGGDEHKGRFDVFVQLNEDSAAAIVKIPELRRYEEEAKELMSDVVHYATMEAAAERGLAEGSEIVSATKGNILYFRALRSLLPADIEAEDSPEPEIIDGIIGTEEALRAVMAPPVSDALELSEDAPEATP